MRLITLFILAFFSAFNLAADNLKAYLDYTTFNSLDDMPYVETYLTIVGNSVVFEKNEKGNYQGSIEVTWIFKDGDKKVFADKYTILSPEVKSEDAQKPNFIDQQRIRMPNGDYEFTLIVHDQNKPEKSFTVNQNLKIDYPDGKLAISGIQMVESYFKADQPNVYTKSGYNLIPYTTDFYPGTMDKLIFYSEVYNSDQQFNAGEDFLINTYVENAETNKIAASLRKFQREKAKGVNVVFHEFPIDGLSSGNYNLVIEVKNKENEVVASKKRFFQRSNPARNMATADLSMVNTDQTFVEDIADKATIKEHIQSLRPISTQMEKIFSENQLNYSDLEMMQRYFLSFWQRRNNTDPQKAWEDYYEQVKIANEQFSTFIKKGYETDRGRVFLQYGSPNTVTKMPSEPSSYPYEIWHYYNIDRSLVNRPQSNKRFVFADFDLANNDLELIHSDAQGEIRDDRWRVRLQSRNEQYINLDQNNSRDHFGNRTDQFFDMPR